MGALVTDCPRCGVTKTTFDILGCRCANDIPDHNPTFEAYSVCRHCSRGTIFNIKWNANPLYHEEWHPVKSPRVLNGAFSIDGYVNIKDCASALPPEHLPDEIQNAFKEAATCLAVECWNAAATMFRLCVDHATKPLLPTEETDGLNSRKRRDLGLRLQWLFEANRLPPELRDLSACIREDGNDGAHAGILKREDAEDLLDFTTSLLERLITEPKRLEIAKERRAQRRSTS